MGENFYFLWLNLVMLIKIGFYLFFIKWFIGLIKWIVDYFVKLNWNGWKDKRGKKEWRKNDCVEELNWRNFWFEKKNDFLNKKESLCV